MALFLEPGSEFVSPEAQADLDAIAALRESAAIELKDKGNEYVKMGKKYYKDAVDCYTRAIEQKSMDAVSTSILYANRAQVHLLLGNNRRALIDAQQALEHNKANVKAHFRGAKAALALKSLQEAVQFCLLGLEQEPNNAELSKLRAVIENKIKEAEDSEKKQVAEVAKAKVLSSIIADRGVTVGKPTYKERTAGRKPWLDDSKLLHWPVLLLYPEFMASDFIEDFCEFDSFSSHLDIIFGPDAAPPPWDSKHDYTREKVQLFYEASRGPGMSEKQLVCYLLEGKDGPADIRDCEDVDLGNNQTEGDSQRWIRVSERSSLHDVLAKKDHVIPGIPVFYVLSKCSGFYEEFVSGRWCPP
eukprot:c4855_g1_i1 orf=110-1183(+)